MLHALYIVALVAVLLSFIRWHRAGQWPCFVALLIGCIVWEIAYNPQSTTWMARWIAPLTLTLIPLRTFAVAEIIWKVSRGDWRDRLSIFLTCGFAIAWGAWGMHENPYQPWAWEWWRDWHRWLNSGTALALLIPLLIVEVTGCAWPSRFARRHAWLLLAWLGNGSAISLVAISRRGLAGRAWITAGNVGYLIGCACYVGWLLALQPAKRKRDFGEVLL